MSQNLGTLIPFVLIILVFWFLVIRPARKRQRDMSQIQSSVSIGAEVMLGSGIYGTVVGVEDDTVRIEVAPGTAIRVARQAVVRVISESPVPEEPSERTLDGGPSDVHPTTTPEPGAAEPGAAEPRREPGFGHGTEPGQTRAERTDDQD